jgi:hypothetical protein
MLTRDVLVQDMASELESWNATHDLQQAPSRTRPSPTNFMKGLGPVIILLMVAILSAIAASVALFIMHSRAPFTLTPTPISPSPRPPQWLTYVDGSGWRIRYPSDMVLHLVSSPSRTDPRVPTTWLVFTGRRSSITITTEPNQGQSVDSWLAARKQDERQHCQIDCAGFSMSPAKPVVVAHRSGILQYLGGVNDHRNLPGA